MMEESQNSQQSACDEVRCDGSAFIITTHWITSKDGDYEQKIKVVADILRRKFDEGLLNTLIGRNMYRGILSFADFCYLSGDFCSVEELPDGRYDVTVPSCLVHVLGEAYNKSISEHKTNNSLLDNSDDVIHSTVINKIKLVSESTKMPCPLRKFEIKNIEGKEPPPIQPMHCMDIDAAYLREIENHGKRPETG